MEERTKPIGRPPHVPTPEQRVEVSRMASVGIPQYQIAYIIGIGVKTLRHKYRKELFASAILANLQVNETLFKMAVSGKNTAASIFWAKTRSGFRQGLPALSDTGADQQRFRGGAKESSKPSLYCKTTPPPGSLEIVGPELDEKAA